MFTSTITNLSFLYPRTRCQLVVWDHASMNLLALPQTNMESHEALKDCGLQGFHVSPGRVHGCSSMLELVVVITGQQSGALQLPCRSWQRRD